MKTFTLNHNQAVLLRRKNKQKHLPKRVRVCENDLDWQACVLGETPLIFPYRFGDDVAVKFDTEEAEQRFLSEIGIIQTSEQTSPRK